MYTEHVTAKLKVAFGIYEQKDTPGYVYKREVPTIIRSAGLNPRERLMADMMKEVHSKDKPRLFPSRAWRRFSPWP